MLSGVTQETTVFIRGQFASLSAECVSPVTRSTNPIITQPTIPQTVRNTTQSVQATNECLHEDLPEINKFGVAGGL